MSCMLTLEQLELLNDSFWLSYIFKFVKKIDNLGIKSYISNFMLFFSSIYAHELIKANLAEINQEIPIRKKELANMRMNNVKLLPMEST